MRGCRRVSAQGLKSVNNGKPGKRYCEVHPSFAILLSATAQAPWKALKFWLGVSGTIRIHMLSPKTRKRTGLLYFGRRTPKCQTSQPSDNHQRTHTSCPIICIFIYIYIYICTRIHTHIYIY